MSDSLRILWLKTGPLHPLDTGGKLRTFNLLRELNRSHEITYFSLKDAELSSSDPILKAAAEYSSHQRWFDWSEVSKQSPLFYLDLLKNLCFSNRPYVIDKYRSDAMASAIMEVDREKAADVIVCDFLTPAVNLFPRGESVVRLPTLLFQHNVEAQIWKRMAAKASNGLERSYLTSQWRRMQRYEASSCARVDRVVGVSQVDCEQFEKEYSLSNVLGEVPTGVDVDFFQVGERKAVSKQLVFLGSMDWLPNIDSVEFFVEAIWPSVKQRHPEAEFVIVGRRPTAAVKRLAEGDSSITVTGTVPDVRPHIENAAAVVVPLRVGGGTRIKIYEAMSMGLPVVSTSIGAEGLDVTSGQNILIEDEPSGFAEALSKLLTEPATAESLGAAAAKHVREHYSWSKVAREFERFCYAVSRGGAEGVEDSARIEK